MLFIIEATPTKKMLPSNTGNSKKSKPDMPAIIITKGFAPAGG
jgi:hypothetical protein